VIKGQAEDRRGGLAGQLDPKLVTPVVI